MSELLPICPPLLRMTTSQSRNAAISVCQYMDYDRAASISLLLALGLIHAVPDGYEPAVDRDGETWFPSGG